LLLIFSKPSYWCFFIILLSKEIDFADVDFNSTLINIGDLYIVKSHMFFGVLILN